MRLPDFENDVALNSLRRVMGADIRDYQTTPPSDIPTIEEIERLASEGIEIPLEDIGILSDGTHAYKGRRVIVYIRDVAEYGTRVSSPKYHLAMCGTLNKMIERGRYRSRYVVATRDDGKFTVQRIKGDAIARNDEALDVCQRCLDQLGYRSFSLRLGRAERAQAVRDFSLREFFGDHGKSCIWAMPRFDANHSPANTYSRRFFLISKALKERRGYRCEGTGCGIDLSHPANRRFLHAHHIDADKSNNDPSNIKLLCIRCHAQEFLHGHVRDSPDYIRFLVRFLHHGKAT